MAYSYANWITIESLPARETALRAHIAEVEADITVDIGSAGKSRSSATIEQKLNRLYTQLERLASINARSAGSTITYARKG